jgi:hypothetical protein
MERQFVVQMDNHPGELATLARTLGQRGINITHISCAGAGSVACAFITTSDEKATHDVLKTLGHEFLEGETVVVDVLDKPGGFADVAEQLAEADIHILGTMCVGRREGILEMAFAVDDAVKAREALPKAELAGIG